MEGIEEHFEDLAFFKYALITFIDVEQNFSHFKNLLLDNRNC